MASIACSRGAPLTAPRRMIAGAVAGYAAINVAALCAAIEFGIQPLLFKDANGVPLYAFYPLKVAVPAMLIGHLTFAGIAEAVVTGGVVAYLQRADPALLRLSAPRDVAERAAGTPARGGRLRPILIGLVLLAILSPLGLLASGTAFGEWGTDEVVTEQARHHLQGLSATDRQVLAGEFTRLADATPDPAAAAELKAGGASLGTGDPAAASDVVQGRLDVLRAADARQYPRIAALSGDIVQPTGMQRFRSLWKAPFKDYAPGFIQNDKAGYIFSAAAGMALIAVVAWLVARSPAAGRPVRRRARGPRGTEDGNRTAAGFRVATA